MEIYREKQDQKLVPIYKFICLNVFVHCKNFTPIPFMLKFLFQIAREKSFDYLLIIYMQKFESGSFSSVVVRRLALFGRLPLPCCRSSLAFPSRTCFELLNSLSRMIECLYSLSARYRSIAVTITRRLSGS